VKGGEALGGGEISIRKSLAGDLHGIQPRPVVDAGGPRDRDGQEEDGLDAHQRNEIEDRI